MKLFELEHQTGVVTGAAAERFVQVTLEAVRQWEYEPTFLNGEPVEVATSIAVNYTLLP